MTSRHPLFNSHINIYELEHKVCSFFLFLTINLKQGVLVSSWLWLFINNRITTPRYARLSAVFISQLTRRYYSPRIISRFLDIPFDVIF